MQDGAARGEQAGAWLREHFKDDPEPRVSITFEGDAMDSAAYRRLLEILFSPRADSGTA